jgi:hypothetical protein
MQWRAEAILAAARGRLHFRKFKAEGDPNRFRSGSSMPTVSVPPFAHFWVAIFTALLLICCARSDPARELRATVQTMAKAIERREPAVFLDALTEDFTRESGAFGKPDAKRVLAGVYLRNEKISVNATVTEVRIAGERATAKLRVIATGGAGLLPERGQTWEIDTAWRRESGHWRLFNAEWHDEF